VSTKKEAGGKGLEKGGLSVRRAGVPPACRPPSPPGGIPSAATRRPDSPSGPIASTRTAAGALPDALQPVEPELTARVGREARAHEFRGVARLFQTVEERAIDANRVRFDEQQRFIPILGVW
jgi:hypothetical protein